MLNTMFIFYLLTAASREPVWPSGKVLGWSAEGPGLDSVSALLSLQSACGLWTLFCHFVLKINETLKWLSSLPISS